MQDTMTEESFLRELIDRNTACAVFIQNGIKLEGRLVAMDENCIFLRGTSSVRAQITVTMLIMKTAISSIVPSNSERPKVLASKSAPGAQLQGAQAEKANRSGAMKTSVVQEA